MRKFLVIVLVLIGSTQIAEARRARHLQVHSWGFEQTTSEYIAHPAGCPRRLFCGCGASVELFGRPVGELFLAANWIRKFPPASPAPGMAAARPGHVFVLKQHVGGNNWLVADYNSGRGQSRIHVRSIAGYRIVNPHGTRYASVGFPSQNWSN